MTALAPSDPRSRRPHLAQWIDDYVADRLESESLQALEAHLVACDVCFAAYLAKHIFDDSESSGTRTA